MTPASMSPLVEIDLETASFAADWNHCDQIANYLAQLVSHDRRDSFLYANLLSTVLNELLEVVYAQHNPTGALKCTLAREGQSDRIALTIPVHDDARAFYERSVSATQSEAVAESYTRTLLGEAPPDRALGFLELAANYGARLSINQNAASSEIHLTVEVTLDDGQPPAFSHA
jgi:hypothetical protein